jgi:hypothetical protein
LTVSGQARGTVVQVAVDVVAVLPVAVIGEVAAPALEPVQAPRVGIPETLTRATLDLELFPDPNLRHLHVGRDLGAPVPDHQLGARPAIQIHEVGASIQDANRRVGGHDRGVLVTQLSVDDDELELAAPQLDHGHAVGCIG